MQQTFQMFSIQSTFACDGFQSSLERKNMAFSYWESTEWLEGHDLIVVGGGIVGVSAALRAKSIHPNWKVAVIERDSFGGGGSTKNAGFACFGSMTELLQDRKKMGDAEALAVLEKRISGLQLLRSTLGDQAIGYSACGSLELIRKDAGFEMPSQAAITEINEWAAQVTQTEQTFERTPTNQLQGIDAAQIDGAISSPLEGAIDTGKTIHALRNMAQRQGVRLLLGLNVTGWEAGNSGHRVQIQRQKTPGVADSTWVKTPRVLIATNAFAQELMPALDVMPQPNIVLVTAPIEKLKFDRTVHMDAGYLYARNIHNRMLIGGGRHWKLESEDEVIEALHSLLRCIFPFTKSAPIEYQWTGILGVGNTRSPIIKRIHPGCVAAVRMGGMGIAIGMQLGKESTDLLLSE
jgi:glycine/D-amino acid oxidase-like deaminating enzyme